MAFSDIKKAILEDAKKVAEEHKEEGRKEADRVARQWRDKAEEKKREIIAAAKRKAEQKVLQEQFKVQNETQSRVLEKKQEAVDRVYEAALDKLASLDDSQYVDLMEGLMRGLPEEDGELVSAKGKEELLKKALDKSGKGYRLSQEKTDSRGGFIFRSERMEIDQSFEALIEASKKETLLSVTDKLFGNQK